MSGEKRLNTRTSTKKITHIQETPVPAGSIELVRELPRGVKKWQRLPRNSHQQHLRSPTTCRKGWRCYCWRSLHGLSQSQIEYCNKRCRRWCQRQYCRAVDADPSVSSNYPQGWNAQYATYENTISRRCLGAIQSLRGCMEVRASKKILTLNTFGGYDGQTRWRGSNLFSWKSNNCVTSWCLLITWSCGNYTRRVSPRYLNHTPYVWTMQLLSLQHTLPHNVTLVHRG